MRRSNLKLHKAYVQEKYAVPIPDSDIFALEQVCHSDLNFKPMSTDSSVEVFPGPTDIGHRIQRGDRNKGPMEGVESDEFDIAFQASKDFMAKREKTMQKYIMRLEIKKMALRLKNKLKRMLSKRLILVLPRNNF